MKLSSPVIRIEQSDAEVKVHTAAGEVYTAKYVISAIPVALLNRITFAPCLPATKIQMIQRVPMGSIIKTMTFYDRAYWKENGLSGQMLSDVGPIQYSVDDTKPDGSHPALMGFILADRALKYSKLSAEERRDMLAEHYAECFRCPALKHPINYVEKNWMEEEYSGGCYVSNFPPGTLTAFGPVLREPFLRTYFAGTETATHWAGYMDGAVEAGERAAREVLHALGKISANEIWTEEAARPDFPENEFKPMFVERILPSVPAFLAVVAAATVGLAGWLARFYMR